MLPGFEQALKTRVESNRNLDCWNPHKKFLVHESLSIPELKDVFAQWVIYGDHAPELGDELFDRIYAHENKLHVNRFFMFEKFCSDTMTYSNCILRRHYKQVKTITLDPYKLHFEFENEIISF